MKAGKLIIEVAFSLVALSGTAQDKAFTQKVERIGETLYLVENEERFKVDTEVVTVKLKTTENNLGQDFKIIRSNRLGYLDIKVPDGVDVESYVNELKKTGRFETVEFNGEAKCCFIPNDSCVVNQWYIDRINLTNAWDLTTGSHDIKVAIMDSGVEAAHSDLGYNSNDGYSQIDTLNGVNYTYVNNAHISPIYNHGTLVAGILGAKTNNTTGIAGVCGGNHSKGITIIPYCLYNSSPFIIYSLDDAILDATDKGVKVINISLNLPSSSSINDAIEDAYANNVTIVCSTGNSSCSTIGYPASHERTIAVGATNENDMRASSSNYGTGLDIVAPGVNIKSTTINNTYDTVNGTSYSTPQVAGVAALMLSVNPSLTPDQIKNVLRSTCKKISGYSYTNGWNAEVGYGLLDAKAALLSLMSLEGPSIACTTSTYTIPISSVYDVSWHFNGTVANPLDSLIHVNNLYNNQCTINSNSNVILDDTLVAVISRYGQPLVTLRKPVYANLSKNLWYSQTPGAHNKYHYPTIPETYFDITQHELLVINPECYITLRCQRFKGMNVVATGVSGYTRIDDETFQFTATRPPTGFNTGLVTVTASGVNGCNNFSIDIEVQKANILMSPSLSYSIDGDNLVLSISKPESSEEGEVSETNINWDILIEEVQSGRVLVSGLNLMTGSSRSINITGWSPGIYTIRATNGVETLTKKIVIN